MESRNSKGARFPRGMGMELSRFPCSSYRNSWSGGRDSEIQMGVTSLQSRTRLPTPARQPSRPSNHSSSVIKHCFLAESYLATVCSPLLQPQRLFPTENPGQQRLVHRLSDRIVLPRLPLLPSRGTFLWIHGVPLRTTLHQQAPL